MMRTVLLGLLGLVLAVAVGFGVHLVTRDTIALPVVQLEAPPERATTAATTRPPATTSTARTTTARTPATMPVTEVEAGDDNSGSGSSGRGRGRGRGGNSGSGGGDD